jgi:hypothetical protein
MTSVPKQAIARAMPIAGFIVAWSWTLICGGGGLMLLVERGPWPLTNGWFALASGVSACPLTETLIGRLTGFALSGWTRAGLAFVFFVAGHVALWLEGMPYGFR